MILLLLHSSFSPTANTVKKIPQRSEIPAEHKWNLTDIYSSDSDFEADFSDLEKRIPQLETFKGRLGESPDTLMAFFNLRNDIFIKFERVVSYARLIRDQDSRDSKYQGYLNQITNSGAKIAQALSWYSPELLSIPWDTLSAWVEHNEQLAVYRHYLDDEFRLKEHVLSAEEERILALAANLSGDPGQVFHAFNDADLNALFPVIKDEEGSEIQLSHGRYQALLESGDGRLRRDAFQGIYGTYEQYGNTLAALLKAQVDRNIFFAQARHYDSTLEYALSADNVPAEVYTNLIEAVRTNLPAVHKYMALRKKIIGLEKMHLYDTHFPLFPQASDSIPYDQARTMVLESLKPLGREYIEQTKTAFSSRWIDVYENAGKASGAYSWGAYPIHPYMLLNYTDTLYDAFTVAHEMGHTMHTYYTINNQPFIYGDYSIFAAEVASTMNEALLMDYLIKHTDDERKKLNLIARYISNINGTVIAQTLFAEFELEIHRMAESGIPLTVDTLNRTYFKLLQEYWGADIVYNEEYQYTWGRIPHFWRTFYVYKYATSFAASAALALGILAGENGAREAYLEFLASGSSDYPMNLLEKAGVDMTTPAPVVRTMRLYSELVVQLEQLWNELQGR